MRFAFAISAIGAAVALAGCKEAPKSAQYYAQHIDEAREKAARCQAGTDTDSGCQAAGHALATYVKPQQPYTPKSY